MTSYITKPTIGQCALLELLGQEEPGYFAPTYEEQIARARDRLIDLTDRDFGYDPRAWYDHLVETGEGHFLFQDGHLELPEKIEAVTADPKWCEAVKLITELKLMEFLRQRDVRRESAQYEAEVEWRGRIRPCPKCGTEFKSVQDRGQCPGCAHVFCASHPGGPTDWWMKIWANWKVHCFLDQRSE